MADGGDAEHHATDGPETDAEGDFSHFVKFDEADDGCEEEDFDHDPRKSGGNSAKNWHCTREGLSAHEGQADVEDRAEQAERKGDDENGHEERDEFFVGLPELNEGGEDGDGVGDALGFDGDEGEEEG